MPPRLSRAVVRQMFYDAGYELPANFHYVNNKYRYTVVDKFTNTVVRITVQQLKYKITHNQRPQWFDLPLPTDGVHREQLNGFERFVLYNDLTTFDEDSQHIIFDTYRDVIVRIMRKRDFVFNFHPEVMTKEMLAITLALSYTIARVNRTNNLVLDLLTTTGRHRYFHVNTTTVNMLYEMFINPEPNFEVQDSSNNMLFDELNYSSLTFLFTPLAADRHVRAGFFPFINMTDTDLSRYGIYKSVDDERVYEPCIITAFKSSNVFTENEINQLTDMIKVRCFPQAELKHISELFNVDIYVRHYKSNGDTSHIDVKQPGATRSLKLMILFDHYALYENIGKRSSYAIIKQMIKLNQLRPMTMKEYETVMTKSITRKQVVGSYNNHRLIRIKDASHVKRSFNQYLFGYVPDEDEVDYRLDELQNFIDTLNLRHHIDVRCYNRFSMLMQKIMYEYGCFDNVFELTGSVRDDIRASLTFPKRILTDHTINEKCYYIDFNGAFCSFMTHIPNGIDSTSNNKINELIHIMYDARLKAKENGNNKFAKTLKFIMCSCYGTSIARPKIIENKFGSTADLDTIVSHNDNGFITVKKSYVEHYNHPQFAKVILDGFARAVEDIRSRVNVLFQNFDAFVVNERDFVKLKELGYIHPYELGKLKVEHVFTSMTFKNKNQWLGVNEDGTEFHHSS